MLRVWLLCLLVPAVLSAPVEEDEKNAKAQKWAVLVAGSTNFLNYRHQADVCHAYQIMHRHGIPDENIIVFMYDDIAYNEDNPHKGVIINRPNGPNVYGPKKVNKDYVGKHCTSKNFLAALTGDSKAVNGKKVLKSGPNDHVFIYYADHGASGMLGFPEGDILYVDDLIKALNTMSTKKMYKKLLFYLEACEAGSMFENKTLPANFIATTASNPEESSWGTYCDTSLPVCLGDEYSVAWMEDTDKNEGKVLKKETIEKQYENVVKNTKSSHPQMYGQTNLKTNMVIDFIGIGNKTESVDIETSVHKGSVPSRDTYMFYLKRKLQRADGEQVEELKEKMNAYLEGREMIDDLVDDIMTRVEATDDELNTHTSLTLEQMPCYRTLVENFKQQCVDFGINTYAMKHMYKFANLCLRDNFSPETVLDIFSEECTEEHRGLSEIY